MMFISAFASQFPYVNPTYGTVVPYHATAAVAKYITGSRQNGNHADIAMIMVSTNTHRRKVSICFFPWLSTNRFRTVSETRASVHQSVETSVCNTPDLWLPGVGIGMLMSAGSATSPPSRTSISNASSSLKWS